MENSRRESLLYRDGSAFGSGSLRSDDAFQGATSESQLELERETAARMRRQALSTAASQIGVISAVNLGGTYDVVLPSGATLSGVGNQTRGIAWQADMSVTLEFTNGEPVITGWGAFNLGKASDLLA